MYMYYSYTASDTQSVVKLMWLYYSYIASAVQSVVTLIRLYYSYTVSAVQSVSHSCACIIATLPQLYILCLTHVTVL